MDEHNEASKMRREVMINTGLDLLLLTACLIAVGNSALDHSIHIVYLMRIGDYSSYRPRPRWPIFVATTPRSVSDMSDQGELVLFSAFRILMRVWLVLGVTAALVLYAASGGWEWKPGHEGLFRLGVLVFGLGILTVHLPKRMLMWNVAARFPHAAAKVIPLT